MIARIQGRSMMPTLRPGDLLWVRKPRQLARGQIVLIRLTREPSGLYVKRIIALPGETVEVRGIEVWIGDRRLDEPYVDPRAAAQPTPSGRWQLNATEYLVLGDARDDSRDSRRFGPVLVSELAGIIAFRLWPPCWIQ